ncbi:hypothetical protein SK128_012300 [Halocaridina rubra]|uniref:Uncharacterized protein n=1 Tax=Halocaridina rubra TaxID=373956 RepID=A0AAN8X5K3_HALRR
MDTLSRAQSTMAEDNGSVESDYTSEEDEDDICSSPSKKGYMKWPERALFKVRLFKKTWLANPPFRLFWMVTVLDENPEFLEPWLIAIRNRTHTPHKIPCEICKDLQKAKREYLKTYSLTYYQEPFTLFHMFHELDGTLGEGQKRCEEMSKLPRPDILRFIMKKSLSEKRLRLREEEDNKSCDAENNP